MADVRKQVEEIEPLPEGTIVKDRREGSILTVSHAHETNNQFGYGKYLYRFKERLMSGFGLYFFELQIVRLSKIEEITLNFDYSLMTDPEELREYFELIKPKYDKRYELSYTEYLTIAPHYVAVELHLQSMQ